MSELDEGRAFCGCGVSIVSAAESTSPLQLGIACNAPPMGPASSTTRCPTAPPSRIDRYQPASGTIRVTFFCPLEALDRMGIGDLAELRHRQAGV